MIAWLKANPDKATAGTAGAGSPPHIGAVFFQRATGTRFAYVPYKGGAPAMQDLVAGQIDFMIDAPVTVLPQLRAGTIKVLCPCRPRTGSQARPTSRPPTKRVCRDSISRAWFAFFAPKGTPKPVIDRLNAAAVESAC